MKPKLFVTRKIPRNGLDLLSKHCTIRIYPKESPIPKKDLLREVKWADALLCLLTDDIDKEVIDANPKLKIIANYAVGYNNIDCDYAKKKNISVTNTPGKLISEAVAEHTVTLMLAISKRIVEADRYIRSGRYCGWSPTLLMDVELAGKTLGIIGLGRIGSEVASRAEGMEMKVIYNDIVRNHKFEKRYHAKFVSLPSLLKSSDFISVNVPLLKSTHHLIGKKELALMKPTSYLINTSRGPVIDEKALVQALKDKKIAGAALDVFECEPKLAPGLIDLDNVILTPHIASATKEAREEMSEIAAKNIIAVLQGRKAPNLVN